MSKKLTLIYGSYKQNKPTKNKAILIVLVFVLIVVLIVSVFSNGVKYKKYDAKHFFFVYAGSYVLQSRAQEVAVKVNDLGGAGVIYSVGNSKLVVVNAYFSELEAQAVVSNISGTFANAKFLKVSAPKLSKTSINKIETVFELKQFYFQYYDFCKNVYNWSNQFDQGEIETNEIYKQIIKARQQFVDINDAIKNSTDKISQQSSDSCLLLIEHINSFLDNAFINNNITKYARKLYVNIVLEFVQMCENIK